MAKTRRRLKQRSPFAGEHRTDEHLSESPTWQSRLQGISLMLLGGIVVYAGFHPSDSVAVEQGDSLWFCAAAILLWFCTFASESLRASVAGKKLPFDALDWLAGGLAAWMLAIAYFHQPEVSLRDSTNEAWLWVAAMAVFSAARRLLSQSRCRSMLLAVLVAVGGMNAVYALYQDWISLPATRAAFTADPEALMREAGIVAPPVSSQRMVFASRLFDGGPTGTFALANSLAGVLVFTLLCSLAAIFPLNRSSWKWVAGVAVIAAGLAVTASNSRSAILILLIAGPLLIMLRWKHAMSDPQQPKRTGRVFKWLGMTVAVMAAFAVSLLMAVAFLGDDELIQQAPDSLMFRFRYWKSSLWMLLDHPWLGAGPGGFRALYLSYRMPVANEVIADPHNFLIETLTSGGIPAGLALGLMALFVVRRVVKVSSKPQALDADSHDKEARGEDSSRAAKWIAIGAFVALAAVCAFGAISNRLPETQAMMVAIPFAAIIGVATFHQFREDEPHTQRSGQVAAVGLVALLVHLSVSGGWTVPGVAIFVWILAAMLCFHVPLEKQNAALTSDGSGSGGKIAITVICLTGCVLLLLIQFTAISPVRAASQSLGRAEYALLAGLDAKADQESQVAVDADTWDEDAAVWRSEYLKNRLLGRASHRSQTEWLAAVDEARERGNDNPLALVPLAYQAVHVYQRFGRPGDLEFAVELLQVALQKNPHDLAIHSILASSLDQLGQRNSALELARETKRLSELDGNLVRHLNVLHTPDITSIAEPKPNGRETRNMIVRSVERQFRERFPELYEPANESSRKGTP
ncbi:MAG: O-antigen ligase family protein [Planctomycetota bacterium]